ncbi:MAG: PqiC family protein [Planctomycetota bacterium]|jgi:uncharacterized lipoprotein YmbA
MTRRKYGWLAASPLLALLALLLAGCGSTAPSRFYVLEPMVENGDAPSAQLATESSVGIGPVTLPEYLDRPQMVTRAGGNRLELAEFDRWAEPLTTDFTRVLADNISTLLSTERIVLFPWPASVNVDYKVRVDVKRFEADAAGTVTLDARWTVSAGKGTETIHRSRLKQPVGEDGYGAVAAAQSKALAELSLEIARAIAKTAAD